MLQKRIHWIMGKASSIYLISTVSETMSCNDYSLEADFINAKDGGFIVRAQDHSKGIALIVRPTHNDIYWAEICWAVGKERGKSPDKKSYKYSS